MPAKMLLMFGLSWSGIECSGVECNGMESMERNAVEWNGMDAFGSFCVFFCTFGHVGSFFVKQKQNRNVGVLSAQRIRLV